MSFLCSKLLSNDCPLRIITVRSEKERLARKRYVFRETGELLANNRRRKCLDCFVCEQLVALRERARRERELHIFMFKRESGYPNVTSRDNVRRVKLSLVVTCL